MSEARLPNLIVVGAPKAGTGSLFAYLSQHPDICPADEKEVGYFNYYNPLRHTGAVPPIEEYTLHFAHCGCERYRFEATPTYSYGGTPVIDAIRRLIPDVRIILTLRNPVDRLWSAYTFQRELGNLGELGSFDAYVRLCMETKRTAADLVPRDHLHGLYIGFYAEYVPLWLDAFGEAIRVLFVEDIARDAEAVMSGAFRWLDIDDDVSAMNLVARNKTNHPRSIRLAKLAYSAKRSVDRRGLLPSSLRDPIRRLYWRANEGASPRGLDPETRARLTALYAESNAATARALAAHGYEQLPEWLATASPHQSAK
jgi:hypothetical protein